MRRLRILRVLMPAVLVLFVVLLVYAMKPRQSAQTLLDVPAGVGDRADELDFIEHGPDGRKTLEMSADSVEEVDGETIQAKGIKRILINREERGALEVAAAIGELIGPAGKRKMSFEDGVTIHDTEEELWLTLPILDVDEDAGEARSRGEVGVRGNSLEGRAASLVYGLEGQPTELGDLELHDRAGARLSASRALLLDGLSDVELLDQVRFEQGDDLFEAGRLRLQRDANDTPRHLVAADGASGHWTTADGGQVGFASANLEVDWDDAGEPERLSMLGGSELRKDALSLAAETINAARHVSDGIVAWQVAALRTVYVQARLREQPAWLRADRLDAVLDGAFELQRAEAEGRVSFDAPDTRAEAARALLVPRGDSMEIRLFSAERRRARLARERTRIAANEIATDERGERLRAEGRVEATLLPADASSSRDVLAGVFSADEAVHFVAARLDGRDGGRKLTFSGAVRGWQGEQNLSAERVAVDQGQGRLSATENVHTRLPRQSGSTGLSEGDYVQISSDTFVYLDPARSAVYEGTVRVALAEGWVESERLEVDLAGEGGGIQQIRAARQVRIEFRNPESGDAPEIISGSADRLVYVPDEQTLWLYGEESPASVRRIGENGGTTTARVLRYRLDDGTLEVDSGERGSGTIKSNGTLPGDRPR